MPIRQITRDFSVTDEEKARRRMVMQAASARTRAMVEEMRAKEALLDLLVALDSDQDPVVTPIPPTCQ